MLLYLSFVFAPMQLRCSLDVPPMYLLFLSVCSTFPSRFLPICSSIYYRTSIGHQSNNKRTSIGQKIGVLRSYSLATRFLLYTYLYRSSRDAKIPFFFSYLVVSTNKLSTKLQKAVRQSVISPQKCFNCSAIQ